MRALVATLACLATVAEAAGPYDPDVPYLTLRTPHFRVSYPREYGHIALRTAVIAERTWPYLAERYDWAPKGRISIVINDQTDYANGSATIVPNKVITIFVTAPTRVSGLEDYDDWLATVVQHEMAHIFHLDMAYGLPWVGRLLFGKYVAMNQYVAAWATEGLAVYEESMSSGSGRGRSHYVDMVVRTAALEDRFPGIDQAYRGYPDWPFSNIAYFFGGRFQLFLAEHYGEDALLAYHRANAANPIPYFTYLSAKLKFDTSLESLWLAFEDEMKAEAERVHELVRTSTETVPERLTFHGGESVGPRITPDGKYVVYSTSSPIDGPRVRRLDLATKDDEPLVDDTLSESITFTPKGDAFYFQQTEINQRFYAHNSILRYDIAKESFSRIDLDPNEPEGFRAPSGSLRARDPDLSPDGKRIVFVQAPYAANRLVLAWLESDQVTIHPKVLVSAKPDVQFANPRFSPDGERIAVGRFEGGRRDVVVYDLDGEVVEAVTADRAQDTDPTWSPDGRWIVFSSDRSGIYNLYAYELATKKFRRLTNLITGAFQPCVSPDASFIAYRGYSADGFDVYRVPFAPDAAPEIDVVPAPPESIDRFERNWPPKEARAPELPEPAPLQDTPMPNTLPEGWSVREYSALETLLPFDDNWNLFPSVLANEREVYGSLSHFGTDARNTHLYALNLTYGTLTNFVGGGATYVLDVLEPTFAIFGTADAVSFQRPFFDRVAPETVCPGGEGATVDTDDGRRFCGRNDFYNERRLAAQLSIGLPVLQRHQFSLSYRFENRAPIDDIPDTTIVVRQPVSGNFARVTIGYVYSNTRAFPYSISLERGPSFGIAISAYSKGLGSDFEQFLLTAEGRYYLDIPWPVSWLKNHVVAARLGIGIGAGPDTVDLYRLGGVAGQSALTTTTENFYSLRGISTSALDGTGVISGSIEYRAPIVRIDRGIGTYPIAARVLHLALFADYGRVFDKVTFDAVKKDFFGPFAVGIGAELRADLLVTYSLPLTLVLGYAYPVVTPNVEGFVATVVDQPTRGIYFNLGSQF
jgi:hypothetical protein